MAHKLSIRALDVTQPGLNKNKHIYVGMIRIADLIDTSMFKVDFWQKPKEGKQDQGYQRIINDRHAQKISSFLQDDAALLPTSILLSMRNHDIDDSDGKITINSFPIYIVDGQHRIAGLRMAIEQKGAEQWRESYLPVVLLTGFSKFEEMIQFVELNTKQKKVETNLALELMLEMSMGDKKYADHFVTTGEDWKVRAIKIVNELNKDAKSSWHNTIQLAGEKKAKGMFKTSANSFATSLKPLVQGVFSYNRSVSDNVKIIDNFWTALRKLFPDAFLEPQNYAIQKTPGLFTLHVLLDAILARKGYQFGLKEHEMKKLIEAVLDEAEADIEFWRRDSSDSITMYGSMKGFKLVADRFINALQKVDKE